MMEASGMVRTYLRVGWRRRWWVLVPLAACVGGSAVALRYLPKEYRASTLILVRPQNIPKEYVKPTVTFSIEDGLKTIRQEITSRTRLEHVARDVGMEPVRDEPLAWERWVAAMRTRIDLEVKQESAFTLSYRCPDPVLAARVANRLADLFIEESARGRQEQARATSEFLGEELERMRLDLVAQEEAIAAFKRRYQAELPEQQDANLRALDALERDLRDNELSLERARDRKTLLETQLSGLQPVLSPGATAVDPTDPRRELFRLRAELADLRSRYTEEYPEVRRLEARVAELEASLAGESEAEGPVPVGVPNPAVARLQLEVLAVEREMEYLQAESEHLRSERDAYRARVENAPQREQDLLSLTRDYDTLKQNYQSLLNKRMEARIAETLEEERMGAQFVVLDPAQPPAIPFRPDPMQVVGIGLLLGLALGVGSALLVELARPTFYSPQQLQEQLGVPVVAVIPHLPDAPVRPQRWTAYGAGVLAAVAWAVEALSRLGR